MKTPINRSSLFDLYKTWVNDYLTLATFAENHGLTEAEAEALLVVAQSCFENNHPEA